MSVIVIAEPGSTHDGDIDKAKRLVDSAVAAGADVFKMQWWSDPDELADQRRVDAVSSKDYRAIYHRYRVPYEWLGTLQNYCRFRGIEFACTAYLAKDVKGIAPYTSWLKLSSFEAEHGHLFQAAVASGRPLLVSTGMTDEAAVKALHAKLTEAKVDFRLLHCVSSYPAPLDDLNLSVLSQPEYDGYSDHSDPVDTGTGALAVAAGADVIEAHIRLEDTDADNPDRLVSMMPGTFNSYVWQIRQVERALGVPTKAVQPSEAAMRQYRVKA